MTRGVVHEFGRMQVSVGGAHQDLEGVAVHRKPDHDREKEADREKSVTATGR